MFLSAKAFFENNTASNVVLIKQAETQIPQEWVRLFKRNVVAGTPKDSSTLRRSIITQALGSRAQIGWRAPYAGAQEAGGHNGVVYVNYTTPGTGKNFARNAFRATTAQMPSVLRQLGLTK